jgi:hypothetical protein
VVTIAAFAARAVRSGRRVAGMEKTRDVMNSRMQARLGYCVEKLPDISTLDGGVFSEALADNTVTPPPDAAAFRIDFPRWLGTLPRRDRRLAVALMTGEGTLDPARSFRVSPARVSQLRRELSQDWAQFHGAIGAEVA